METDFLSFEDPKRFTQYVRGEMYFFIDSLLSLGDARTDRQLEVTRAFINDLYKMVFRWMEIFPNLYEHYRPAELPEDYDYQTMDQAISNSGYEFIDYINKTLGNCPRCSKHLSQQKPLEQFDPAQNLMEYEQFKNAGFKAVLLKDFLAMDGFDKI